MKFDLMRQGPVHVFELHGELTGEDADEFMEAVTERITGPTARVALDLADVRHVNSTGLSQLVRLVAQANVQEARLVLARPAPFVAGVLQTTQLDRFFEVHPTLESALQALQL